MISPSDNRMSAHALAAQLLAICRNGFKNEFHHARWLDKHAKEILGLPVDLRDAVLLAHDQAGPVGLK